MLAYLIFVVFIAIFVYSKFGSVTQYVKRNINIILTLIILQILLGALVVGTGLRFYLTAIHLSVAIVIFALTLISFFRISDRYKTIKDL